MKSQNNWTQFLMDDNHPTLSEGWQRSFFLWGFACTLGSDQSTPSKHPSNYAREKPESMTPEKNNELRIILLRADEDPRQMP